MELNLELTRQTKILLGILVVVLIAAVAIQWGPGLYGSFSNSDMKKKRQILQTSKDLVAASKILKPIETGLYKEAGLTDKEQDKTIFDGNYAETVIREKIDAIVKEAGIPQNYQLDMDPVPGKKSEIISPNAQRNLIVFLYQKKLETERDSLNAEIEAELQAQAEAEAEAEIEAEDASLDMLMDAWLDEVDEDAEKPGKDPIDEKSDTDQVDEESAENSMKGTVKEDVDTPEQQQESHKNQIESENLMDIPSQWEFASLPKTIPSSMRIELIELIISMTEQHLVGAETEKKLFETQLYNTYTEGSSGFFGIGAKKPMTEINFRPNSQILAKFTELIDYSGEALNEGTLTREFLEYLERVQSQIAELSGKLQTAPTSYSPESYTVKMKFKAELNKLVNLNRLIETRTKWLMVRDLQISVDNKENKVNVNILMIARVYQ